MCRYIVLRSKGIRLLRRSLGGHWRRTFCDETIASQTETTRIRSMKREKEEIKSTSRYNGGDGLLERGRRKDGRVLTSLICLSWGEPGLAQQGKPIRALRNSSWCRDIYCIWLLFPLNGPNNIATVIRTILRDMINGYIMWRNDIGMELTSATKSMIKLTINNSADIEQRAYNGETSLLVAYQKGTLDVVQMYCAKYLSFCFLFRDIARHKAPRALSQEPALIRLKTFCSDIGRVLPKVDCQNANISESSTT